MKTIRDRARRAWKWVTANRRCVRLMKRVHARLELALRGRGRPGEYDHQITRLIILLGLYQRIFP
jgi:hypothetical protein